jgi:hypothetical protein
MGLILNPHSQTFNYANIENLCFTGSYQAVLSGFAMNSINFMALLAQQQTFSPYFSKIDNLATHDVFYDTGHKEYIPREDPAYLIFDIPGYLNPEINDFEGAGARNIKVSRYPGFLINLEDYAYCT